MEIEFDLVNIERISDEKLLNEVRKVRCSSRDLIANCATSIIR